MTMKELAKLANVSLSTVSKAFHDTFDVSTETKEHIFELAKQYGCYEKYYKGKYQKKIIAIICPELESAYYNAYVEKLQKLIKKHDGIALISSYDFETESQEELLDYYISHLKVDGVFVLGMKAPLKKGYDIPVIALLSDSRNIKDSISVDLASAIQDALAYLNGLGHQNILFSGEALTRSKEKYFLKSAENFSGTYRTVCSAYRFEHAGEDCAEQILALPDKPTAIVCAYDNIAIGLIRYLTSHGYSVPEDFSVIGMDNNHASQYMEHSLTSIDSNPDEVCSIAWDLLSKKLQNSYYKLSQRIIVTGRLIIRESTGKPRE